MLYDYLLETFGKNEPIFLQIFVMRITPIFGSKKSLQNCVKAVR